MRKLLALLLIFASTTPVHAATKELVQIATLGDATGAIGVVVDKNIFYTFGTIESATTDAVITTYDAKGLRLSQRIIDGGGDEYISAAAGDSQGNVWFVGGDAPQAAISAIDTATSSAVNPDGVVPEAIQEIRKDISTLVLWKLNSATSELTRYSYSLNKPVLATAIAADGKGISLTAVVRAGTGLQNILISATSTGRFTKPINIGGIGTTINALTRNSDGSIDLFGSSIERLGNTKLAGKVDGVLIKVRNGKISLVVRSTGPQAVREWVSASGSVFLTGSVQTGKKIEVAATRFIAFKPVWTVRYPSTGRVSGTLNSAGAFLVYSTQTGITLATFTTKGIPISQYSTSLTTRPVVVAYSGGPLVIAEVANQAVLFAPTTG